MNLIKYNVINDSKLYIQWVFVYENESIITEIWFLWVENSELYYKKSKEKIKTNIIIIMTIHPSSQKFDEQKTGKVST